MSIKLKALLLIFIISLMLPLKANNHLEKHRIGAGERNENGWYLAESINGNFSALFPIPFNDYTLVSDDKSRTSVTYGIGITSSEGINFSVQKMYFKEQFPVEDAYKKIISTKVFKGQVTQEHTYKSFKAATISVVTEDKILLQRFILVGDALFQITTHWPKESEVNVRPIATIFLDTLEFGS